MHGARSGYINGPATEGTYDNDEVFRLRELREAVGMHCEQMPLEVREALHAIPDIEKQHGCAEL